MGLVGFQSAASPVLIDTSFLVSVYDKRERHHASCVAALNSLRQPLVTCEPVITETLYHLQRIRGAPEAILESIELGLLKAEFRVSGAARKIADLMAKYADTPCDFADACLITMADELGTGDILTLDSDFRHYRWRRNRRFRLLVSLD